MKKPAFPKIHPWKRIQAKWAFRAWAKRNPEERKTVELRFAKIKGAT